MISSSVVFTTGHSSNVPLFAFLFDKGISSERVKGLGADVRAEEKKGGRSRYDRWLFGVRGPSRQNRYTVRERAGLVAMIPRFSSKLLMELVSQIMMEGIHLSR